MSFNRVSAGFVCAIDYAGLRDHSAISVGELIDEFDLTDDGFGGPKRKNERHILEVVHSQRLPLKLQYPRVNEVLCNIVRELPSRKRAPVVLADAGGVGRSAIQYLNQDHGLKPIAITVTGGNEAHEHSATEWSVPKRILVSSCSVGMQEGRLKISPDIDHVAILTEELRNFVIKTRSATGNQMFEASTESVHDDVVTTLLFLSYYAFRPRIKPAYYTNAMQGYMER